MSDRGTELITELGLIPHPEGGFYGEVHRSESVVRTEDGRGSRAALSSIYFLLSNGATSRWHRVLSDEIWHFYEGAALELWIASPDCLMARERWLGPLDSRHRPVLTVPAGWWQAARSTGGYTLVGCTVGPGFDFDDFELAADQPASAAALRAHHPSLAGYL
ncbi:MAG TPA: cupin domain-containing protein [Gemmatimonadales bacterium]|nr:cupin domain-containing protein [Gemmatimonadales bacterium]